MPFQVVAPPPVDRDGATSAAPDPEALIREARSRARRRRARYAAATLVAVGAGLGAFFAFGGGGPRTPRHAQSGRPPAALPQAGTIEDTVRVSPLATVLFTARGGSLFALVIPPMKSVTVMRVDAAGTVTRLRMAFRQAAFLQDVSAGPAGIYAGTSVIRRFTNRPDELIRIDARTLTIRARASFPSSVATVESGNGMWATLGDGRVMRLDPRTLAIQASRRILPAALTAREAATLSKPAFGLGSVWVLAGNAVHLELVRLDPLSLTIRSRTPVPTGGKLAQALHDVTGDSDHVYLVGGALASVGANGRLIGRPKIVPGLANAASHGGGLVGVTAEAPGLVVLDPHGRTLARTPVADAGAELAISGQDVWFLGAAGHGNGIVHVRLPRG